MRRAVWEMGAEVSDIAIVPMPERLDSTTSAEVEAAIMAVLRNGAGVIADGGAVEYMSAAGVRVLVDAFRKAGELGARLALARFTGAAEECLAVSGFGTLLTVAPSVDEARRKVEAELAVKPAERLRRGHNAG
jgi:anti-anti-sigma factor